MNFSNFKLPLKSRDKLTSRLSTAAKISKTIPLSIFALLGLVFFIIFGFAIWETIAPNFWEKVNARVITAEIETDNSTDTPPHALKVTYSYLFRGKEFTGTKFSKSGKSFSSISDAQKAAKAFEVGNRITCLVNKDDPKEAYIEATSPILFAVLLIPLVFVAIGVAGIISIWETKTERKKVFSRFSKSSNNPVPVLILGGVFTVIGILVIYFLTVIPYLRTEEAKAWVKVPCKILQSYVRSHDSDDGTTYSVYILYSYSFLDKTYKSDKCSFSGVSTSNYSDKEKIVNSYPVGNSANCYVNPKDYEEAVIVRKITGETWFGLFGLVFVIVGVVLPAGILHERKKRETKQQEIESMGMYETGPVTLKRKDSKVGVLFFLIIFSLFWNTITWMFLVPETGLLSQKDVDIGMTLFAGVFVLLGAGVSFAVVHTFLTLFNPKPVLVLDSTHIAIGETCNLGWTIAQGRRSLESLKITLTATEEFVRQGSGKNESKRSTLPFYEDELVSTQNPHEIYRGEIEIEIPINTMHSFESAKAKIVWLLTVKGSIPKWPDIKDSYEIIITPAINLAGEA